MAYGIFIMTFYLTFFLAYTLTFYLTFYPASILTFYLASIQAFILASIGHRASILTISLTWALLDLHRARQISVGTRANSDLALVVEVQQCPRLRLRSSSAHCDLALAVQVRQCPLKSETLQLRSGLAVPSGIWSSRLRSRRRRRKEKEEKEKATLTKSKDPGRWGKQGGPENPKARRHTARLFLKILWCGQLCSARKRRKIFTETSCALMVSGATIHHSMPCQLRLHSSSRYFC